MGKDHDFWMSEANKFWAKKFPNTQKEGPFTFVRLAIPINDKPAIQKMADVIRNTRGSPFIEMNEAGQSEFFSVDFEVLEDRIVAKFIKCAMEDYNGHFFE